MCVKHLAGAHQMDLTTTLSECISNAWIVLSKVSLKSVSYEDDDGVTKIKSRFPTE